MPWAVLTIFILVWGVPPFAAVMDRLLPAEFTMPWLHQLIRRVPPIQSGNGAVLKAVFKFHLLSATGTGIFAAAVAIGVLLRVPPGHWVKIYVETAWRIRWSLLTIATMLALGNLFRYSGTDGTLGLTLARTGRFYPFFGTLLGWIGAAITGSDTSTNVLFGSLQKITAQQIGVSPILMCAANTCGGVMGKMVSSQSIVVASTATDWYGQEGKILRYVLWCSLVLSGLMGLLVLLASSVSPFTRLVSG